MKQWRVSVALETVVAVMALEDGWTNIEAERFREYLMMPDRT